MTREKTAGKEQTFRVRAASPEDLPVLSKIEKACFSDPWSVVLIRECLDNPSLYRLYAAEDEEGVFGYSVMSLVLDEAGIDNLAVLPGHRRSGAGQRFFHRCYRTRGCFRLKARYWKSGRAIRRRSRSMNVSAFSRSVSGKTIMKIRRKAQSFTACGFPEKDRNTEYA